MFTILGMDISIRQLRAAVCAALALIACLNAWSLARLLVPNSQIQPPYPAARDTIPAGKSPQESTEDLAGRHLFGTMSETDTKDAPIAVASSIRVIGILMADAGNDSWAIVDTGAMQKAYNVGAKLPDGEILVAIQADRVTLEKDGNRYSVLWDMQPADIHARFRTITLTAEDSSPSLVSGQAPDVETQRVLHELREQLLAKKRLSFTDKPSSADTPDTPPNGP